MPARPCRGRRPMSPTTCCRASSPCSTPFCRRASPRIKTAPAASPESSAADAGEAAAGGIVAWTKRDRLGVGRRRLGPVAQPFIGLAAYGPNLGIVGIGLGSLIQIGRGLLGLAEGEITGGAAEQRLDLLRVKAARGTEIGDGEVVLVLALVDQGAAIERLRIVGIEPDRVIEFIERGRRLAGLGQGLGLYRMGLGFADVASSCHVRGGRSSIRCFLRLLLLRRKRPQVEGA